MLSLFNMDIYGTTMSQKNDFIGDAAGPLIGSVNTKMSVELERYIYKKAEKLNL